MPSRKSDTRRSDASVAKTSLAAEDSVMTIDTDATADESSLPADTSSMPPPPAPPATASSEVSSEKKDKEKDKDKDAVAIEVGLSRPPSLFRAGLLPALLDPRGC